METEKLEKLQPDRDLQCYFERPSAIAAISDSGPDKFTVSGTWRQQFDWAVIEWNRDNVFEHPLFRNLPDADLSGLTLTYEETRENCIPLDSSLYPTVDWPFLRVWAGPNGKEQLYRVPIRSYATPIAGGYQCAAAQFELTGTITGGDYVGISWFREHHTYQVYGVDTLETVIQALVDSVRAFSPIMWAERIGTSIKLYFVGNEATVQSSNTGVNGNRMGAFTYIAGSGSFSWDSPAKTFSNGQSPTKWKVTLPFGNLIDSSGAHVPTGEIRKMRWTYSADMQPDVYARSEFAVKITNWSVTGTGREYKVAGRGSRRLEDDARDVTYQGSWSTGTGNFSGGTIRYSTAPGSRATWTFTVGAPQALYLGTRYLDYPGTSLKGGKASVRTNGGAPILIDLRIPAEDVLARVYLGTVGTGSHTVEVTHAGVDGTYCYLDFLELVQATATLPTLPVQPRTTLATDWDTDHSIAIAPERTAWMIHSLGFRGRANNYVGALWFYELMPDGHQYASGTVTFTGVAEPNKLVDVTIGRDGQGSASETRLSRVIHPGDTLTTIAKSFEMEINSGYTAVRAQASGNVLTIYSRRIGADGDAITLAASTNATTLQAAVSGAKLSGGIEGKWHTDLNAEPRINRAARDWARSFLRALKNYGIDAASAFSTELQHGDTSEAAGIAQRYPSGDPVLLNTPAIQTNFSPASRAYWKKVYQCMAQVAAEAGQQPYLQFGEVQWWYFPDTSGLPFYDTYTKNRFASQYGRPLPVFRNSSVQPAQYPQESAFLANLIGEYTTEIMQHVRASFPNTRFEVLYPTDVNETPFNRAVNYPAEHWTPGNLDCLKTESFTYTFSRDLNACKRSMTHAEPLGFPISKRSHLIGAGDPASPWIREIELAKGEGLESIVIFALDQVCLIGYPLPLDAGSRRSFQVA